MGPTRRGCCSRGARPGTGAAWLGPGPLDGLPQQAMMTEMTADPTRTMIATTVLLAALTGCSLGSDDRGAHAQPPASAERADGRAAPASEVAKPRKWQGTAMATKPTDEELRTTLTPEQYHVTQQEGTEPPFRNAYWDNHAPGIYVDVVSRRAALQLARQVRFRHGLAELHAPARAREHRRARGPQAVHDAHRGALEARRLAPRPRLRRRSRRPPGQRYCMNSAALRFIPVDRLEAEGYGEYLSLFRDTAKSTDTKKSDSSR